MVKVYYVLVISFVIEYVKVVGVGCNVKEVKEVVVDIGEVKLEVGVFVGWNDYFEY